MNWVFGRPPQARRWPGLMIRTEIRFPLPNSVAELGRLGHQSMRVGLVRHFPVSEPMPSGWMTAAHLHAWRRRYDCAGAQWEAVTQQAINWARCYSSDLKRAYV